MRLDHIALRTKNRHKTAKFFIEAFGYKIQQEFKIDFGEGKTADCIALEPPEKKTTNLIGHEVFYQQNEGITQEILQEYHMPPEIFISDGLPGSIVGDWVEARGGIGGIHHMAYQVENVEAIMHEWTEKGYAEFASKEPMRCPEDGLVQVFTKPGEGGIIFEFIERKNHGFCSANVKSLMLSTAGL